MVVLIILSTFLINQMASLYSGSNYAFGGHDTSVCYDPGDPNYTPLPGDTACVYGCIDPIANNYNSSANHDDGSCTYPPGPISGCTDPNALNYDPNATQDDGSCTYPSGSGDPIDLSTVQWVHSVDSVVSTWNRTANLNVGVNGKIITLNYDKANVWPSTTVPGVGPGIVGSPWIFIYLNGQWHADAWEYLGQGQTVKDTSNLAGRSLCGVLDGSLDGYTLQQGEWYGFMVSGVPPNNMGGGTNIAERSNIVMLQWNGIVNPKCGTIQLDLTRPNSVFYQALSQYTNAAKSRGIYTLLAVYNMWMDDPGQGWDLNPFNPANNVNPETDPLTNPDIFITELGLAMSGDTSTVTRNFLRNVWYNLILKLAQNTPDTILFQPLSEPFKDSGQFNLNQFLTQANQWWGKNKLVDNPPNRNDPIHPQAIYRDYHDISENPNLLGPDTIVNTDVICDPPPGQTITLMASEARNRGGNYLVYDCSTPGAQSWLPRVNAAINSALGGVQPSISIGQGTLIGYGGPDFWMGITANGSYIQFLDELKNAGGNLTFALAILNNSFFPQSMLPWELSTGQAPLPLPPAPGGSSTLPSTAPTISSISPGSAPEGTTVTITGQNLDNCEPISDPTRCNVQFFDLTGARSTASGNVTSPTSLTVLVPSGLCTGAGSVRVGSLTNFSNSLPFNILNGTGSNCIVPPPSSVSQNNPIIYSLNPMTVGIGGTLEIIGDYLTPNVQFYDASGGTTNVIGWVNAGAQITTVIIPEIMLPGIYNVGIAGMNSTAISPDVLIIIGDAPFGGPSAASAPLLPAATKFQDLITSAYDYSLILVGIAVFIMIMWGGFLWMTSAANPGNINTAKGYIRNAIIGAILLASSYVILNTISPELVGGGFSLRGLEAPPPPPPVTGNLCPNNANGLPDNGCSGCVVMNTGVPRKSGVGDIWAPNPKITASVDTALTSLITQAANQGVTFEVTEAYCPTVSHLDLSHYNGQGIDIALRSSTTAANLDKLCQAAEDAGFTTIINEYSSLAGQTFSVCPTVTIYGTTTGNNLHLEK
ncbi:MAG: hypothetical protein A3B91_01475 [Candidatus Yanofskybacteria bacterium RIFCSPHIGHO2_02_FULL_41_29]|uniref:IPT/TIG domain-containing protein n=1 Tax=Candidatus Yanofskybacteria bacterium RIFCSPHIGHO2_01_FULL_41_53 TaxID=1802663 RepID=A0A1F8EFR8_9BACT|nr:MAG: hypothetical protein A2650_00895 [Candidatus Yanofskybacteria bacterium RIFCSPHIGHO2_01_FULL_41_53]OGN11041.1 MAG: hypothetical protein A3B91_01475 [Candidatus Yanofskybacteria bacterium RIFCSPHIGHO2_02_FULL_41_29]OGN21958.1 MAG: hypothetical protein A2916_02920 [Candidatus Yanofskybacteria bacterium RIFCSPLOWO2_01_FULL_41_67]OGN30233.1 MAG: hypothetical protein A3H54_02600 [Candidatus Yanofskybacteria bacterium RIFCSPLOWO2_02_FULL_41_13]